MIVADASLLAHLLIPGLDQVSAQAIQRFDWDWRVPGLWQYELRNVLLQYIRAGALTGENAVSLLAHAFQAMDRAEQNAPSDAVLSVALTFAISSYDAEYIALAQTLRVPLVTFDRKLTRAAPGIAFLPADYLARP